MTASVLICDELSFAKKRHGMAWGAPKSLLLLRYPTCCVRKRRKRSKLVVYRYLFVRLNSGGIWMV